MTVASGCDDEPRPESPGSDATRKDTRSTEGGCGEEASGSGCNRPMLMDSRRSVALYTNQVTVLKARHAVPFSTTRET